MEKEITINGKVYVPKGTNKISLAKPKGKYPYKLIRTYSAGVFAGYLKKREGKEVTLINARRIFYWEGASSLSQLAMEGTKTPDKCKFAVEVSEILLTEAIEVINITKEAQESIQSVKEWRND